MSAPTPDSDSRLMRSGGTAGAAATPIPGPGAGLTKARGPAVAKAALVAALPSPATAAARASEDARMSATLPDSCENSCTRWEAHKAEGGMEG